MTSTVRNATGKATAERKFRRWLIATGPLGCVLLYVNPAQAFLRIFWIFWVTFGCLYAFQALIRNPFLAIPPALLSGFVLSSLLGVAHDGLYEDYCQSKVVAALGAAVLGNRPEDVEGDTDALLGERGFLCAVTNTEFEFWGYTFRVACTSGRRYTFIVTPRIGGVRVAVHARRT